MQTKNGQYQIRNFRTSDRENYIKLHLTAVAKGEEEYLGISPKQLQVQLEHHGHSVGNNLFFLEKNKEIIGSLYAIPEKGIGRIILYCFVHPAHRRKKIGDSLFARGFKHASALGLSKVHVNVYKDNSAGIAFLERLGFQCVRKYLEMQRSLLGESEYTAELPTGFHFRCMHYGEEKILAQLQNDSFRGSWGFNPNTAGDIKLNFLANGGTAEDVILVFCGEKPVGYCWTLIDTKKRIGKVHMIGVKHQYRGKNLGKALLNKSLSYLVKKGMKIAVLTVDSCNKPAKNLYYALGFSVINTSLWYEKRID